MGLDCYLKYSQLNVEDTLNEIEERRKEAEEQETFWTSEDFLTEIWYGRKTWKAFEYFINQANYIGDANCEYIPIYDITSAIKDLRIIVLNIDPNNQLEEWEADQIRELVHVLEEYENKEEGCLVFYGWY